MVVFILELNGYRQLVRLEPDVLGELERGLAAAVESRGGTIGHSDNGVYLYRFEDSGEAEGILAAGFGLQGLLDAVEPLRGYILLAEAYPGGEPGESVLRDMKSRIFNRETGEGLLVGRSAADLFQPHCELESADGLFRARPKAGVRRPGFGKLGDFLRLQTVPAMLEEELARRARGDAPPEALLVETPPFSGMDIVLGAALEKTTAGLGAFTLFPSPREPDVPAVKLPPEDELTRHMEPQERLHWDRNAAFLAYLRNEENRLCPDFPVQDAGEALPAALDAYLRACRRKGATPVVLCRDRENFSESAGGMAVRLFRDHLEGRRLQVVFTSPSPVPPGPFASIPYGTFPSPPLEREEFLEMHRGIASDSFPPRGLAGIFKRSRGRAAALYYELAAGVETPEDIPEEKDLSGEIREWGVLRPLVRFLLKQERVHRETLYVLEDTEGMLPRGKIEEFLEKVGINRARSREIIRRLGDWGLPGEVKALPFLEKDPSIRRELLDREAVVFLHDLGMAGAFGADARLLRYFVEKGSPSRALDIFRLLVSDLLDRGNTAEAASILKNDPVPDDDGDGDFMRDKRRIVLTAGLRLALAGDDADAMGGICSRLGDLPSAGPRDPLHAEELIQRAMCLLKLRDPQSALSLAKRAVMIFQETRDRRGSARANGALGSAMLAGGSSSEAVEYFRIGREAAGERHPRESYQCALMEAIAWFTRGNFSRVLEICPGVARAAEGFRQLRWSMAARFIQARANFELGEYGEAGSLLKALGDETRRLGLAEAERMVSSWSGRCLAFQGDHRAGLDLLDGFPSHPEALYFAAEAEYFQGDIAGARERIEAFLRIPYGGGCFLGDAFLWKDGFYFLENLAVGRARGSEVLPHLGKTFSAFLSGLSRDNPAAIEDMARLIMDEKDSKNDPYKMLHFYWYSRILPEGRDQVFEDRTTVLGQAVRHLKARASRIDDTAHNHAFQWKNAWNRKLLEEARRSNLI